MLGIDRTQRRAALFPKHYLNANKIMLISRKN